MEGRVVGIEIKSGETVRADDFKGLKNLKDTVGEKFVRGIILYLGPRIPFGKDFFALPISSLWA